MRPDVTKYPRHKIKTRGATYHAIPVDDPKPHWCHIRCRCKPNQIVKAGGKCEWNGLWMHNVMETK